MLVNQFYLLNLYFDNGRFISKVREKVEIWKKRESLI